MWIYYIHIHNTREYIDMKSEKEKDKQLVKKKEAF